MAMIQIPKCIMDDILQKDTQLNAQLGQVQLKTTLVRLTLPNTDHDVTKLNLPNQANLKRFHSQLRCETRGQDSISLKLTHAHTGQAYRRQYASR